MSVEDEIVTAQAVADALEPEDSRRLRANGLLGQALDAVQRARGAVQLALAELDGPREETEDERGSAAVQMVDGETIHIRSGSWHG